MRPSDIIKRKFKSAIIRGTGETYLLMQQYPQLDFSSAIIYASIKNCAYDGQCEPSRVNYLWGLIRQSKQPDKIRAAILKALSTRQKHTWTLVQLFNLTKKYAELKDKEAYKAIYKNFMNDPEYRMDWPGYVEILELDGLKGLLFIADKIGRQLDIDAEAWDDDGMIKYYELLYPEADGIKQLEAAGSKNKFIKLYADEVKRCIAHRAGYKPEKTEYKDIVDEILSRDRLYLKELSEADLMLVAQRLIIETDQDNQTKLIRVFAHRKYPLNSAFILSLIESSSKELARWALRALQHLTGDEIRKFALDGIAHAKDPSLAAAILTSNYKEGDHILLTELAIKHHKENIIEGLVSSYISIYSANPSKDCRGPLEVLYQKSNCGVHRSSVVRLLIANDVLSGQISSELPFDCDEEVRGLIG